LLPFVNQKRVDLLVNERMPAQMQKNLERRSGRGGTDTIDHPKHGHDDVINAAGALVAISGGVQCRLRRMVRRLSSHRNR
jgi:hypothetical protein